MVYGLSTIDYIKLWEEHSNSVKKENLSAGLKWLCNLPAWVKKL
ncbi:MAG: hypothetical protein JWP44_1412 [Mucilaginibacter sp.]|nr:hypothetical protein [Mucilaginibacter sp.]